MTKIIIGSTTDLPEELIEKYGIDVLPLRVNLNSKEYLDKIDIDTDKLYEEMKKGIRPLTSSPFPKEIYKLFEKYLSQGEDIIYYAFSSELSGTYGIAYLVIEELKTLYPQRKIKVIDTKSGALATGLIVHQGAKLAEMGKSFEEIVEISKENVKNIEHLFTIDDLTWLSQGGRISKSQAIIGGALNIKPLVDLKEGKVFAIDKVRGRKKSLKRLIDIMNERIKEFPDQIIAISHAGDIEAVEYVKNMVIKNINPKNIIIERIGSVVATHVGIGGVGVFFFNKKPAIYIEEL